MAITILKYIDITSGVGAGQNVRNRDLIGRIFTLNPLVPAKSFIEFTSLDDVLDYFGSDSEEYRRATFYFGWISKNITRPKKLTFARWANTNLAPRIFGLKGAQAVASWTAITAGEFTITIGGESLALEDLDFSGAASLSDVASIIQTEIRLDARDQFAGAVVLWDAVRQSFNFTGTFSADEEIEVTAGTGGVDIAGQLGWLSGAILSDGVSIESLTETLSESAEASSNFGTYAFIPTLTLDQWKEIGAWNQANNILFMAMVPTAANNYTTWAADLLDYAGLGLTIIGPDGEYPEMVPMMILAATDYNKRSSVQNYMFQIFGGLTPTAQTTLLSNAYDAARVNYYGRTQTAGQIIEFYQRGVLMGKGTAPTDMNIYANEMWLKDAATAALMELLLNKGRVSANAQGRAELGAILQSVINKGLFNGTISVGKALTAIQKVYISELTGDEKAWHQVQNIGYWFDVVIEQYVAAGGNTEFKATYTLIYSKDDAIRKIEGSHVLI